MGLVWGTHRSYVTDRVASGLASSVPSSPILSHPSTSPASHSRAPGTGAPPGVCDLRALLYFGIRYFLKGGFLDGSAGWMWNFWQGLWYRWIVDREIGRMKRAGMRV